MCVYREPSTMSNFCIRRKVSGLSLFLFLLLFITIIIIIFFFFVNRRWHSLFGCNVARVLLNIYNIRIL
ncbi:hypothetical protein PUN28_017684 [Cardiocondyla obscurior]|uniref:Uncharacterized protein n=1 Tax=Cardiocondyla obscurior TaxID=286306 RepID=A0AAW2EKW5_9HYME